MHRENRKIHRQAALIDRQGWVKYPANARAKLVIAPRGKNRTYRKACSGYVHPERQIVHSRKCHIRRADLKRHEIVAKAAKQRRNHNKEHHQNAVGCDQNIPKVSVRSITVRAACDQSCCGLAGFVQAHVLNPGFH